VVLLADIHDVNHVLPRDVRRGVDHERPVGVDGMVVVMSSLKESVQEIIVARGCGMILDATNGGAGRLVLGHHDPDFFFEENRRLVR